MNIVQITQKSRRDDIYLTVGDNLRKKRHLPSQSPAWDDIINNHTPKRGLAVDFAFTVSSDLRLAYGYAHLTPVAWSFVGKIFDIYYCKYNL